MSNQKFLGTTQVKLMVDLILGETPNSVKIRTKENPPRNIYIPMSHVNSIHKDPNNPYLMVSTWIAKKEGLIPNE